MGMGLSTAYNDQKLFQQIAEGNEDAFTQLFENYVVQLGSFVLSLTHSQKIVDDVVQETFLRVWMNRDKLPEVREPKSWLYRIAANLCYTWRNRTILEKKVTNEAMYGSPVSHNEVTEILYVNALKATVQEAVSQLSPQRARIYQLNRQQGLTVAEIADQLSLSPQTVRNTLSSSLDFIRDYLHKKGYPLVLIAFFFKLL